MTFLSHLARTLLPGPLLALMLPACSSPRPEPSVPAEINVPIPAEASEADRRRLEALRDEVAREVGSAQAATVDLCRVLPLGKKPCGGPWAYVVYSESASDSARLHTAARAFDALQDRVQRDLQLGSDCAYAEPPEVELVGGACRAVLRDGP